MIVNGRVAAGFAATFNTPISGALFTIEVILADLEIVYLGHIVIAAIVAVLISRQFLGDFPTFTVASFGFHHNSELLIYLALGVLAGVVVLFALGLLVVQPLALLILKAPLDDDILGLFPEVDPDASLRLVVGDGVPDEVGEDLLEAGLVKGLAHITVAKR